MNTVNKQALLDAFNDYRYSDDVRNFYNEIQSGRFDSPSESDQLRTALEQILTVAEDSPVKTYQRMEDIARKALSTTEPTGAERVQEAIEAIEEEMCDDFSPRAQRINEQLLNLRDALGITIPDKEDTNE